MPDPTAQEIAATIGAELFGSENQAGAAESGASASGGGSSESLIDGQGQTGAAPKTGAESSDASPPPPQNLPQPFNGKPLPKAWKKDMQPHWEKLDPSIHDYVYEREANVMRGLQQYQQGHERWNELISPFKPLIEAHPDLNHVQLLQNLMHNHLGLLQGSPEQKLGMVKKFLDSYGIPLSALTGQEAPPADQRVQALEKQLQTMQQQFAQTQRQQQEALVSENLKVVENFFSDPKNEFAEDVGDDIAHLLKTGAAKDLPSAYEMACWSNPVVREKMLAKQREAESKGQPNGKPPVNIEESGAARTRSAKPKTWQEDVDATVAKHYSTH